MDLLGQGYRQRLRAIGAPESAGNLYLMHFAGEGGASAVLRVATDTPVARVLGAKVVAANPFLKGMTAGDLIEWAHGKMGEQVRAAPKLRRDLFADGPEGEAGWAAAQAEANAAVPPRPAELSISDYVDAYLRGEGRDNPEMEQFAANNAEAIEAEFQVRQAAEAEGPPPALVDEPASMPPVPPVAAPTTPPRAHVDAVLGYVRDGRDRLAPEKVATALGITPDEARAALSKLAGTGASVRMRPDGRFVRVPTFKGPVDLIRFLATGGGIRDGDGHNLLRGRNLQKLVPGVGPLIRKGGASLDEARRAAVEAGYFHGINEERAGETSIADFLDLLEQAHREPHYAMNDLGEAMDLAEERRLAAELEEVRGHVADALAQTGFAFDRTQQRRAAALVQERGLTPEAAIWRVIDEDVADAIDTARLEAEEQGRAGDYSSEEFDYDSEAGRASPDDDGWGIEGGDPGPSEADLEQYRSAAWEREAEADRLTEWDDPHGKAADDQLASDTHDLAAAVKNADATALDRGAAVDPAIAERQRQQAQLKAAAPMRAATDQEGTIGSPLFDAVDQFGMRLDDEGDVVNPADLLAEIEADEAAIRDVRDCL